MVQRARAAARAKCNALGGNAVTSCSKMFGEGFRALPPEFFDGAELKCNLYLFVYNVIKFPISFSPARLSFQGEMLVEVQPQGPRL